MQLAEANQLVAAPLADGHQNGVHDEVQRRPAAACGAAKVWRRRGKKERSRGTSGSPSLRERARRGQRRSGTAVMHAGQRRFDGGQRRIRSGRQRRVRASRDDSLHGEDEDDKAGRVACFDLLHDFSSGGDATSSSG